MKEKSVDELLYENAQLRGDLLTIAARISHDLRTPLGGILTTMELLKEIFKENEIPAEFNSVFKSVDEMMALIRSVSLMAKASANPPPPQKIRMSDAVYHAWQRSERQISRRGARVMISRTWPEIFGIADWLEFIWWQFLSNALRYGGKEIELGWRNENGTGKFFARDDGGEISQECRAGLFQPFDELHQPNASRGVGLSMVRRLVEQQNGSCGYEFDGASVFYFTLPMADIALAGPDRGARLEESRSLEVFKEVAR